jgi:hypothetical protein
MIQTRSACCLAIELVIVLEINGVAVDRIVHKSYFLLLQLRGMIPHEDLQKGVAEVASSQEYLKEGAIDIF